MSSPNQAQTKNIQALSPEVQTVVELWQQGVKDSALKQELCELTSALDAAALQDAFYQDLSFGTAGLRGVLGVGTNRMNRYVVARATQGLATYLNAHYDSPTVCIARDSRLQGDVFQTVAAQVLAANKIHVYLYPRIEPVPALSFAVRFLKASAGIVLTASHNPAQYNGYKVYNDNGGQITDAAAQEISANIAALNPFADVATCDFDEAVANGLITWMPERVLDSFLDAVQKVSIPNFKASPNYAVVYTPLNGTGMECVTRILERIGVTNVAVVDEQKDPDGNFPTCKYPNPEFREALELALDLANKVQPNLVVATDPDADRMGTAVPHKGSYELLSGNEMGILLMHWLAKNAQAQGEDLRSKVAVTTIVSSAMADALARKMGFELRRVLTGFKYIGDQIDQLKSAGEEERFLMGFEESYGYLVGTHVRDKDAIVATQMCVEMASDYAERGMDLVEAMDELYQEYGYYLNGTVNVGFAGEAGAAHMTELMAALRTQAPEHVGSCKVVEVIDYAQETPLPRVAGLKKEEPQTLPAANVIELKLQGNNKVIFRPSGTEPKIKAYVFAKAAQKDKAQTLLEELMSAARAILEAEV